MTQFHGAFVVEEVAHDRRVCIEAENGNVADGASAVESAGYSVTVVFNKLDGESVPVAHGVDNFMCVSAVDLDRPDREIAVVKFFDRIAVEDFDKPVSVRIRFNDTSLSVRERIVVENGVFDCCAGAVFQQEESPASQTDQVRSGKVDFNVFQIFQREKFAAAVLQAVNSLWNDDFVFPRGKFALYECNRVHRVHNLSLFKFLKGACFHLRGFQNKRCCRLWLCQRRKRPFHPPPFPEKRLCRYGRLRGSADRASAKTRGGGGCGL